MLGGNTELFSQRSVLSVFFQNRLILSVKLFRVQQKFCSVPGERHAPAAAVKQGDPQFLLQLLHGAGQGRL